MIAQVGLAETALMTQIALAVVGIGGVLVTVGGVLWQVRWLAREHEKLLTRFNEHVEDRDLHR